jgi:exopolysaccharide biosynthesis protein
MKLLHLKKRWILLIICIIALGITLYKLADRYLIEHIEVTVPPLATVNETSGQADGETSGEQNGAGADTGAATTETEAEQSGETAVYDDWSYKSDTTTIQITQHETGTGGDKITYFVADVQLTEGTNLLAAFAKNAFGRNITEATSDIAAENNAILAINGDYYGFRSDGVIIRNGVLYRDEPVREALALFSDGTMASYNEQELSSTDLLNRQVIQTYSFGPTLIDDGVIADDLDSVTIDTNFGNRSIQSANPRTGIGMIAPNHYVFVVVDGRQDNSRGMTLTEFAQLFDELGATEAYNLDGGGSSTMYFMGRVVNNPQGKNKERGVSDILYVGQ